MGFHITTYSMNMTTEQKQIAIAEWDGFIEDEPWLDGRRCWIRKDKPAHIGYEESDIPPYLISRDAICGAVAKLPDWDENGKDKAEYSERLAYVVGANWSSNNVEDRRRIFEATASQMADALLLTLGHQI
jgi:hypothetical protein